MEGDSVVGGFAIVLVEVPLAAAGRRIVHQQVGELAHVTVEIFHTQLLASVGPAAETLMRADEALVFQNLHRARERFLQCQQ